jgi:uncharacterized protein YhfF
VPHPLIHFSGDVLLTIKAIDSPIPNPSAHYRVEPMNKQQVEQYWQAYLTTRSDDAVVDETYVVDQFGDHPRLADELAQLVLAGIKTATCSALCEWEAEGSALPEVGLKTIVLDGNNQPLCIIETTEVTIQAFSEVDAQFAYEEGEDDRSLESWRREHWSYFSRVLHQMGMEPTPEMPLVCERFRIIYQRSGF